MEPFTTNILASKTPSTIKEWEIKRRQVFTLGGKKNSQGEDIHLGDAVYYELFSFSERQQQLQGSSGSCGEKNKHISRDRFTHPTYEAVTFQK